MSPPPPPPRHTATRRPRQDRRAGPAYLRGLPASVWRRALTQPRD
jgi:hypothetical protein